MYFRKFPILRLVMAFALGIVLGHYLSIDLRISLLVISVAFLLLVGLNHFYSLKLNLVFGLLALGLFFQLGVYRLTEKTKSDEEIQLFNQDLSEVIAYRGWVSKAPDRRARSYKLEIEAIELIRENGQTSVKGKVFVYTDTLTGKHLRSGDILLIEGKPNATAAPANPFEFDYQEYLKFQNVHFQQYQSNIEKVGNHPISWIRRKSDHFRNAAIETFQHYITDQQLRSIALALVLGQKDELDTEVSSAFAASGAMHVLAVSGLHVGLIYLIFSLGFKRLPYAIRKHRWLEAFLSILILVCYALLTGLSPSVMRAVTMFGFMAIGRATGRNSNIYNSLAASALVLLIVDPYLIMSVGFQLSYLAVIGIVYLQPTLYGLLKVQNKLLDRVWAITCVSLAAQIATAPLSMLYFHQFPTYFLVSNLFIIPAAFVILNGGLSVLLFSFFDPICSLIAAALSFVIKLTHLLVSEVSQLPYGQVKEINLTVFETWTIYGIIVCLLLVFVEKKTRFTYLGLAFSIIFCFNQLYHRQLSLSSNELVVFDIPQESTLHFKSGNQGLLIADSSLVNDYDKLSFHIYPYRLVHQIPQSPSSDRLVVPTYAFNGGKVFVHDGLKVLKLNRGFNTDVIPRNIEWDVCILESARGVNAINANEFVLNSSRYGNEHLMQNRLHSIAEDGYYLKTW